jgi:hypothetical protein
MNAETASVQDLARDALRSFETATREDGSSYVRRTSDAPEWLQELVFTAHGDMLPNDWRYACIAAACEAIAESDDPEDDAHEFADSYVDVYTASLYEWLGSNLTRQGYCDDAREEFGPADDLVSQIMQGQYMEALEVYGLVLAELERLAT